MIATVAAVSANGVIGINGKLPWEGEDWVKTDQKFFRDLTSGHIVLMGRKTYESIGKPLPNRQNWVVSRSLYEGKSSPKTVFENLKLFASVEAALSHYQGRLRYIDDSRHLFVIGGSLIYSEMLEHCDTQFITEIRKFYKGDTLYPRFDPDIWQPKSKTEINDEVNIWTYQRESTEN